MLCLTCLVVGSAFRSCIVNICFQGNLFDVCLGDFLEEKSVLQSLFLLVYLNVSLLTSLYWVFLALKIIYKEEMQ